jgi:hypothetical protein
MNSHDEYIVPLLGSRDLKSSCGSEDHGHAHDSEDHGHAHGSEDHGHAHGAGGVNAEHKQENKKVKKVLLLAGGLALLFMAGEIVGGYLVRTCDIPHASPRVAFQFTAAFAGW